MSCEGEARMRVFFSVGEPSGDVHGANLVRELHRQSPDIDCVGFGGPRMHAAGCRLDYPLAQLSVMGFRGVFEHAGTFARLLFHADRCFRRQRPDALVLIDYPGFNWWMARRARAYGIPVYYFVPPQLWAWASWRVYKMRRLVDHVLCSLPFELAWFRRHGIAARYFGHPFFDDLANQRLDAAFLAQHRIPPSATAQGGAGDHAVTSISSAPSGQNLIVGLLPGSRHSEVKRNWAMLYHTAARIHAARPEARFLVACYKEDHQREIEAFLRCRPPLPLQTFVGRTPEIIELSTVCVAVSGSVSLELLWRGKPTAIVYRINPVYRRLSRFVLKSPYICLVNLMAGEQLYPEFLTDRCESAAIAAQVLRWLNEPGETAALRQKLTALRRRVAQPGACAQAASYILKTATANRLRRGQRDDPTNHG
ncbi:MAG: lipid-A-disaccharide synthetase [Gemmataceae bacterium]|nr:lipid-A-disaccharide synthetase [Gemmataceae bacterium]